MKHQWYLILIIISLTSLLLGCQQNNVNEDGSESQGVSSVLDSKDNSKIINEEQVMIILESIFISSDGYKMAYQKYPSTIADLTLGNSINTDNFYRYNYYFECSFSMSAFSCKSSPTRCHVDGDNNYYIDHSCVLSKENCDGGVKENVKTLQSLQQTYS
ncbi:hypothetical protein HYX12_04140 [Candidatus Woesearchaeota archaeon]|nr:hypothetical protein [Candidatus Woesearchaeota archaeon]